MNLKIRITTTCLTLFILAMLSGGLAQDYRLQLGHGAMESHPTHLAAVRLAELVAERSDGELVIEVFPNRQLGEERELVEGLQLGTVDMAIVSTGPLGGFVPAINVVDMPFLFEDSEHAYTVFDGPIGQELLDNFRNVGIVGAAIWENGWRHLTSNRPIQEPSDLQGVKIRTMENEIHMAAFRELGAGPVPMVWGEVYTSLQQGVIDAQENPITIIYTNALWEVQDYVQLTGHVYGPHVVLISEASLNRLPEELQTLLLDTIREVSSYQREKSAELTAEMSEGLRSEGMEILEVDTAPFREAMQPVYDQYAERFGRDLIDRIRAAAGN